jgi:SAM-dependent methyltransferase
MHDLTDTDQCPACGNARGNRSFKVREMMFGSREEFPYYECADCGCLWIASVPGDLSKHYEQGYYSLKESALRTFVQRRPAIYRALYYARRRGPLTLPEWWPSSQPVARDAAILDVGSGVGRLLLRLKALGYTNLVGVDPFINRDIRVPNGPGIFKRSMEEIDGRFELVIMNHSLEHIADSRRVFGEMKRLLAPSGQAVIRTPVASSLAWREYGSDWVQLDAPRHLVVHTVDSIAALSKASALHLEAVTHDSTAFQFWGSEQCRRDIPLMDRRSYLISAVNSIFTRAEIDEFTRRAIELNQRGEGDQASFYLRHQEAASSSPTN